MESVDLCFKFKDAGHILGSSFVEIRRENGKAARKILFSGDVGRPEQPVMKDPTQVFDVDYLVLESTYGDRLHSEVDAVDELRRIIVESYERGGVLVIPAFAVGRTQLLLYLIRQLEERKEIPILDIYVDSPMAINTTEVFLNHMPDFDLKTRIETLEGKKVFHPERLHICRERDESVKINEQMSGAIIISASGMVTGGRILHHLANRLPRKKDTVLFIGYQEEGTRGRAILEGNPKIKIHGKQIKIAATIENLDGFSGHGDYRELLAWLMGFNQPPEMTFIVHGNEAASAALARRINDNLGWKTTIPGLYDSFELDF
jgi:metallo-beta-lactamase family protein